MLLVFALAAYMLYLCFLFSLNVTRIRQFTPPFRFLFLLTVGVVVTLLCGLFLSYYFPFGVPAATFVLFYGIVNFYVWLLAFAYTPLREVDMKR